MLIENANANADAANAERIILSLRRLLCKDSSNWRHGIVDSGPQAGIALITYKRSTHDHISTATGTPAPAHLL